MQRSTKKFGLQPRFVIFKITLRISLYIRFSAAIPKTNHPQKEETRKR